MTIDRPKRLSPPAPFGSMLKRDGETPQRRAHGADARGDDPTYLALVRQCPCLYCGLDPCGEAAHVKFACAAFGMSNMLGKRVDDARALPLCGEDHRIGRHAQHQGNERAFWEGLGIVPYQVTQALFAQRGDLVAMRAVIFMAIAGRSKR